MAIPISFKSARIIQVYDELSDEIFQLLVINKKRLSFVPGKASKPGVGDLNRVLFDDEEIGLPQPEEYEVVNGVAKRHANARLQTSLTPGRLNSSFTP